MGASTVTATNNSGVGALVTLNGLTRSIGSTVNFVLPTGVQSVINGVTTTTLNTNGILGGYATVGGTDWATNATNTSGGNIIGLSSSTLNGYTNDTWGTNLNTTVTTSSAPSSGSTTNSLRFNAAGANTITLAGTNVINSGGILVTSGVGSNLTTIKGGILEGANGGDLVIFQNNTSSGLTIASTINDNTSTGLTLSGPGLVTLTGTNNFTGGIYLNSGTLNTATSGINAGSTINGITFNGGTLQASGAITTSKAINIGANGGTIDLNGNAVTLNGKISGVVGEGVGAGLLGGFAPTGVGLLTVNNSNSLAATLQLGGTTSAYYGGLTINGNTTVQNSGGGTGAFSSGYTTLGSGAGTPTLDLHGNNTTIAGIIGSGTNGVVTNSSIAGILTLNGVANATYGGLITGSLALTKSGTGTQILTNTDTYTGNTTVNQGTLLVNGTLAASAVSVLANVTSDSAVFGGTGTVGAVTVGGGASGTTSIIAPAGIGTIGTLTTGNVTAAANSAFDFDINTNTLTSDLLKVSGLLSLGSNLAMLNVSDLGNATLSLGTIFQVASFTMESGTFTGLADGADLAVGANTFQVNYGTLASNAGFITLESVTAVPEASTYLWLSLCFSLILSRFCFFPIQFRLGNPNRHLLP